MPEDVHTYLLTLEVEPMAVGASYIALPMHCTLVSRFLSYLSADQLASAVQGILAQQAPIELKPKDHLAFGPKKQLVTMLEPTHRLLELHDTLYKALNNLKVRYTEADWVGEGYKPHVTDKNGERLDPTKPFVSTAAYLVSIEHPLKGHKRFICQKFPLL